MMVYSDYTKRRTLFNHQKGFKQNVTVIVAGTVVGVGLENMHMKVRLVWVLGYLMFR